MRGITRNCEEALPKDQHFGERQTRHSMSNPPNTSVAAALTILVSNVRSGVRAGTPEHHWRVVEQHSDSQLPESDIKSLPQVKGLRPRSLPESLMSFSRDIDLSFASCEQNHQREFRGELVSAPQQWSGLYCRSHQRGSWCR